MNVITSAPMFVNAKASNTDPSELYSGSNGELMKKAKENAKGDGKKRRGMVWDKTKGAWVKAQDTGLLSSIGAFFGAGQATTDTTVPADTLPDPNAKQPMSTTTKILIGVGVAAAIGLVWYATRPTKGK